MDAIYEQAPFPYLIAGSDGRMLRMNDACLRVFPGARMHGALLDLFDEGTTGRPSVQKALARGWAEGVEVALRSEPGAPRWASLHVWPKRWSSGMAEELHVALFDVTPLVSVRERVLGDDAAIRILGDSAPVLLWMAGADAKCTHFNMRWLEFTGRSLEQEMGDGWAEGVHAEDFQSCIDTYMDAFVDRRPFRTEYRLRRGDGTYRWVLDTGLPRFAPGGRFEGFIGSCVDVTELKETQVSLAHTRDALEERVRESTEAIAARDEFLSVASHELRTPLAALVLQLANLQRTLRDAQIVDDRMHRKIDRAVHSTDRLARLVDGLLDVSRGVAGRLVLEREPCDLAQIARDVADRMIDEARKAGCELSVRCLVAVDGFWDRVRLEQVVVNLVSNAFKYGAGRPVIVSVSSVGTDALLEVLDHGIGIAEADIQRIFVRFERAVPSRNYGGLGLGLYIARQIVEAHGGRIVVESLPGTGAVFRVSLPLGNPGAEETPPGSPPVGG